VNQFPSRQRTLLIAGIAAAVLLAIILLAQNRQVDSAVRPGTVAASPAPASASPVSVSGLPLCSGVPVEVREAVILVRANGPYLRPRDDGDTFGNRERLLPAKPNGYYREYTVEAPDERFPGPRRLVTGGQARLGAEPETWFYTADHYESFCELHP